MINLPQQNPDLSYCQQLKSAALSIEGHYGAKGGSSEDQAAIRRCATYLRVYPGPNYGTFVDTFYCHLRHCPFCQWRKALKWRSKMHQVLYVKPEMLTDKWLYLTLTTRNCHVTELKQTIKEMKTAFRRLKNREFWKNNVTGGIRFLEVNVDRSDDQYAHPHFHCLLKVRPSMHQGKNYVSTEKWANEWQSSLQTYFQPHVHVSRLTGLGDELRNEILNRVSYSMKPRLEPLPRAWFLIMAEQMKNVRTIEPFGQLSSWLSEVRRQDDCELKTQKDEIREGHTPATHLWDATSGIYRID